ncbi:MAG: hypothetical protein WCJ62_10810 [Flavobacterium sp.]
MEAEVTVATPVAPTPAPTPAVATTPTPATATTSNYEEGGAFEGKAKGSWKMVDILIMALWIVVPIYGIMYYRKAIKKLDEQPSADEFDNMSGDIEEIKYNVQKALGKKYQKT